MHESAPSNGMYCSASVLFLERRHHLAAEQLARRDAWRVVELVAQRAPLHVHPGQEVRQPADSRLRQHELEARMPLERAREHHRRERLVELQRQQRRERRRLPFSDLVAELRRGPAPDVEADRQPGVLRGRPEPVPSRIADVDVEDTDDRAPVTRAPRSAPAPRPRPPGSGWAGTRAHRADRGRPR